MSQPSPARQLHAPVTTLVLQRASDADTAAAAERICRSLRSLSQAELEALELAAQGMPAEPMRADGAGDPVSPQHAS